MKMKKYIMTGCIAAIAMSASIAKAMTDDEKAYIKLFGMVIAQQSGASQLGFNEAEIKVFLEGIAAGLNNEPMPENIMTIGEEMGEYLSARAEANATKQLEATAAETEAFWKKIGEDKDVQKSASGLAYRIIEQGSAPLPKPESQVVIKYTGKLIDGTVFDTSDRSPSKTATFAVGDVIKGFAEGLQKVGKGGKAVLYIPSDLAYGPAGRPGIPPHSTLIFEIEVLDVLAPTDAEAPNLN